MRIYRDDAVSVALHVSRHPVAGTQGIIGEPDDSDGFGPLQQVSNRIRLRHEIQKLHAITSYSPAPLSVCTFSAPVCGSSRRLLYWMRYFSGPRLTGFSSGPARGRAACAGSTPDSERPCSSS